MITRKHQPKIPVKPITIAQARQSPFIHLSDVVAVVFIFCNQPFLSIFSISLLAVGFSLLPVVHLKHPPNIDFCPLCSLWNFMLRIHTEGVTKSRCATEGSLNQSFNLRAREPFSREPELQGHACGAKIERGRKIGGGGRALTEWSLRSN
ncbi:hypothetical protein K1719_032712 [Acacia pycnantha]|nr:hypothetical protein K1719_032712 [Acacia pycnantha]